MDKLADEIVFEIISYFDDKIDVENTNVRLVNKKFNSNVNSFAKIKSKRLQKKLKNIRNLFVNYSIHKINHKVLFKNDLFEYRSYINFCKYVSKKDEYTL